MLIEQAFNVEATLGSEFRNIKSVTLAQGPGFSPGDRIQIVGLTRPGIQAPWFFLSPNGLCPNPQAHDPAPDGDTGSGLCPDLSVHGLNIVTGIRFARGPSPT